MSYKINGTDIAAYGAVAGGTEDLVINLSELFSFPKRKGETERNWGTSVEPFVGAQDLAFEGRTMTLNLFLMGSTRKQYAERLAALRQACVECVSLSTDFGDFDVIVRDAVSVQEFFNGNAATVKIPFWQETVVFAPLTLQPSGGTGYRMDGYNLSADFGIAVSERKEGQLVGKRIDAGTSLPYMQTLYREPGTVTLACYMSAPNLQALYGRMMQFHALCAAPGLRQLRFPDDTVRTVYVKEGFSATVLSDRYVKFDLKMSYGDDL